MLKKNLTIVAVLLGSASIIIAGCNSNDKVAKTTETPKDTTTPVVVEKPVADNKRAPIINITDTLSIKRYVLVMKDSAATSERISMKLGEIYGIKLGDFIKKNKLKVTGAPMAWYKSEKAPYFFEAGLPVDKKPSKLSPGIMVKETPANDSVIVAHFYGPYDLTPQAYDAVSDLLKDRKKKMKYPAYEIYVDDSQDSTGRPKDPYRVQTDIVFPYK